MKEEITDLASQKYNYQSERNEDFLGFHGFGGSPFDYKPLTDILIKHNVRIVLPKIDDALLVKVASNEISVQNFYNPTSKSYNKNYIVIQIYVGGFSMGGGAMSSVFASKYHISKLLLLALYYGLTHFNNLATPLGLSLTPLISHIPKFQSEEYSLEKVIKNINVLYTLLI